MSSYVGRYRSRLFNFLSQQTRRWADEGDRALRHIKVGAIWGTQILLYPVYLLFQAARLAGRQLQQALSQNIDRADENIPSLDTPVWRVLETAVTFSPSAKLAENDRDEDIAAEIEPNLVVRGIACEMETRQMVLVTTENEIADTLDRKQEQEIQKLISLEISDYLRDRIIAREGQPKPINRLPALDDRPHILPPLRFFRQAMAWVQKSPVARLVNLFQEEAIVLNLEVKAKHLKQKSQELKIKNDRLNVKSEEWKIKNSSSNVLILESGETQTPSFLVTLDVAIAQLEAGNLGAMSEVTSSLVRGGEEFFQIIKSRFGNSGKLTHSHLKEGKLASREIDARKYPNSPENIFDIQILIKAAIDYFFGKDENSRLSSPPPTAISASSQPAIDEESPWLTENDLFGEPEIVKPRKRNSIKSPSQKNELSGHPPDRAAYLLPNNIDNSKSPISKNPTRHSSPPKAVPVPTAIPNSSSNTQSDRNELYYDAEADWIEIKAKPVGYVMHPLEQILQWLDRAMLWLEELIVQIWRSFRG